MPLINRVGGGGSDIKFLSTSNGTHTVPAVKGDVEILVMTAMASDIRKDKVAFVNEGFVTGVMEPVAINFYNYDHTYLGTITVNKGNCIDAVNEFASKLKDPNAVDYYSTDSSFPLTNLGGYKFGGWIHFTENPIIVPESTITSEVTEFPPDYFLVFDHVTENMNVIAAFHECAETLAGLRSTRYLMSVSEPSIPVSPYMTIKVLVTITKSEFGRYFDPYRNVTLIIDERVTGNGQATRVYPDYFKGKKLPLTYEFQERALDVINRQRSNGFTVGLRSRTGFTIAITTNLGVTNFLTPFSRLEVTDESGTNVSSFRFAPGADSAIFYVTGYGSNENNYHEINFTNPDTVSVNTEFTSTYGKYKLVVQRPTIASGQTVTFTFKDMYYLDSGASISLEIGNAEE